MAVGDDGSKQERGRSGAEWVTLAVSVVILTAFVGAALYEQLLLDEPPGAILRVELQREQTERRGDRFYIPYKVSNTGAAPAEDVFLLFEVRQGEEVIEESDAVVPFLPSDGVETGEVVLVSDPAQFEVSAQVGNFIVP